MEKVSVPCGACGKPLRGADTVCQACGAAVGNELKRAPAERMAAWSSGLPAHNKKVKDAQNTIGGLAILFILSGTLLFFVTRSQVQVALSDLRAASSSAQLQTVEQGARTVGELRAVLERRPWQVLGLNWLLAALMCGLWIWSKRAVFPAIISALGIYVAVQVANLIIDPATVAQGVLMKVLVVFALARGVNSALAARRLETAR